MARLPALALAALFLAVPASAATADPMLDWYDTTAAAVRTQGYPAAGSTQVAASPNSQRRGSVLPRSHRDTTRKAFEKLTKQALPGSHRELARAIERETRENRSRIAAVEQHARATDDGGEELDVGPVQDEGTDVEPMDDVDGELGDEVLEDLENLEEQQAA